MGNNKKKRVFQVAREFNISNEALINFLVKLDHPIRNHMSLVTDKMYEEVVKKYSKEIDISDKHFDFKRKLKEKRAKEEEKKIEAQRKYEEKVRASIMMMNEKPKLRHAASVTDAKLPPQDEDIAEEKAPGKIEEKKKEKVTAKTTDLEQPEIISKEPKDKISQEAEEAVKELIAKKPEIEAKEPPLDTKKEEEKKGAKKVTTKPTEIKKKKRIKKKASVIAAKTEEEDIKEVRKEKPSKPIKAKKRTDLDGEEELLGGKKKRRKLKAKERAVSTEGTQEGDEEKTQRKKRKKKRRERLLETGEDKKEKRKKSKKKKRVQISEEEVEKSIRQTLSQMEDSGKPKKRRKKSRVEDEAVAEENNVLKVHEFITVGELSTEMDVEASEVIKKCLELGTMVSINQRLDEDTIVSVADEFGFEVELVPEFGSEKFEEIEEKDDDDLAAPRSPVVTIMGHVDHGKTSLLDFIRESNITDKESGGITQHIGAYEVYVNGKSITFLDTPGHEAFAAMRARGAQVTDIVILVVAADDNVMPQTIEAINHAKAAGVPIVVAINKIDKANANVEMIKKQLADRDVLIESWGGKYQSVEISAKSGIGIDKLLESIIVEAEILELKANPDRLACGVVIESKLDKGKGIIATVLVQKGNLKIGDPFIAGQYSGRVRGLFNDRGQKTKEAGPSQPVMVLGFAGLPQAGDTFTVLESEKDTKEISFRRQQIKREQDFRKIKHLTLDQISKRIKEGQVKELSIILKGDVDGSVEAIGDSLSKLSNSEVGVKIIHKGVGAVSESDVLLASASDAVVIGFQVRPTIKAREIAQRENVDIRLYKVIYDAISDVKDALEGLLEPEFEEKNLSVIEVREIFKVPKIGLVAGCYVVSGKVIRNDKAKLFRNDKLVYDGKIDSLRRFKEDAKEVVSGFECGLALDGFDDIKVNDVIETYRLDEVKRLLVLTK